MIICLEKYFCNQIISRNSLPVGREMEEEGAKDILLTQIFSGQRNHHQGMSQVVTKKIFDSFRRKIIFSPDFVTLSI